MLTKKYNNGFVTLDTAQFAPVSQETMDVNIRAFEPFAAAVKRLAEYEDAEKQGLLVRLPCKVGDTIYYAHPLECREAVEEYVVTGFCFDKGGCQIRTYNPKGVIIYFYLEFIGKTVFLTREEAERALKEARA